jgi:dTDP-4-dehydrorhamnose 3,5-epimerase
MEKIIHPTFFDNRGSYTPVGLRAMDMEWTQCSISVNEKPYTFRGLHYQTNPPQRKYIKVIQGEIVDFAIDLNTGEVDHEHVTSGYAVYIPEDKAHGFLTLVPNTIVVYLVYGEYNPESEHSLVWSKNPKVSDIVHEYVGLHPIVISDKDQQGK